MRSRLLLLTGFVGLLALAAAGLDRRATGQRLGERLDRLAAGPPGTTCLAGQPAESGRPAPGSPLLASWRSVAGCGASSATGGGAGVKWIGRSVTGGLFGVQCQASYSPLLADRNNVEHHFVVNTLITREITDRFSVGINLPFVYKYLRDPYELDIDLSNGGLGDVSLQVTRQLGPIGATALTATVGLPTGKWDTTYRNSRLRQHQQLGFGRPTGSLTLDHTMDQTWGLVVLGGLGSWRGGQNEWESYRAASGSAYSFAGLYLGPFVPTIGLSTTGFLGHDRDLSQEENSAIFVVAANVSIEWSTDWIAILAGASLPYQYDAVLKDSEGFARNPWRWGQWVLGLGVSLSPF
jgi:hypothetical protein